MDALMKNLSLNPNIILYRSVNDAVVHFDKICRTCLSSEDIKCILDVVYENSPLSELLEQHVSIKVVKDDLLPKHICDNCIVDLIKCYHFKTKCLLSEKTLGEIMKYNRNRKIVNKNVKSDRPVDAPFVLQHIVENDVDETTQTETHANVAENASSVEDEATHIKDLINTADLANTEEYINLSDYENDIVVKSKPKSTVLKENVRLPGPVHMCNPCGMTFKTKAELIEHQKEEKHVTVRKTRTCPICAKVCYSGYFKSHLRTHNNERPYKCKQCARAFTNNNNLKRHMMIHTGERPFICEICGKGFIRTTSLYDHMKHHQGNYERKPKVSSLQNFICEYCGKCFKRQGMYKFHLQRHMGVINRKKATTDTGIQTHVCEVCERTFSTRPLLKAHQLMHGEKTFLCSDCGKAFCRKASLDQHLKVHTGEKPYRCWICDKKFAYIGSFDKHMLIHTGEKPYNCKICARSFTQVSHLKYHLRTHSGEKPYTCNFCQKRFALKGNLTVHVRMHTGETPYVCPVCERGFYDSSSMKKHRRGHGEVTIANSETEDVKSILERTNPNLIM